ncbi:hypothetical protein PT974_02702 [Cladobotryum mycophilum]|uniref:DnaJ homologue subfamily C member 28 conserved domain-containing protein n=1 Tax=Cladobotryum mycophilum TaxID=491253 RepID=A0ABR0SYS9_9HYPO
MLPYLNTAAPFVCRRCLIAASRLRNTSAARHISQSGHRENEADQTTENIDGKDSQKAGPQQTPEPGAMTRRLQEATEEALFTGGAAGRQAVRDAGFSDDLKEKLLDKVANANFKDQYASSFAEVNLTSTAGEGTRHVATAQPWTGEEQTADAVLRMLDDAKKPLNPDLRGKFQPPVVDPRVKRTPVMKPGQRAATARDRASMYAHMGMKEDIGLSEKEKEDLKREFRARFEPTARAVPATISGLAALANERIEEAIAGGKFNNLPRGKPMEADPMASNPYVDTTEYLMNRIIQRQEIVPPWIEKQQELAKAVNAFRVRLRTDWKRHVSRMIASKGGTLEEQMARAEEHAVAERVHNAQRGDEDGNSTGATTETASVAPFRDPVWEKAEHAYMNLSVENLNSITRSYNLMAPELAKKPYFSLQRELASCYADVAPFVAKEIKERAARPASTTFSSKPSPFKGEG